jgi:hypothetical protein
MHKQRMAAALVGLAASLTHFIFIASTLGLSEFLNAIADYHGFLLNLAIVGLPIFALTGGTAWAALRQRQAMPVRLVLMFAVAVAAFFLEFWVTSHLVGVVEESKILRLQSMESFVRVSIIIGSVLNVIVAIGVAVAFSDRRAATANA